MQARLTAVFCCIMAIALSACIGGSPSPHEYLDEKTAVTLTVADKPLVFAHERPELAAHSREYVTLAAAAVNHSGAVDYYLFVYLWSTVDKRASTSAKDLPPDAAGAPGATTATNVVISADDRQIRPQLLGHSPQDAGVGSALAAPPGHHWNLHVYKVDLATLHFLSEARQISVTVPSSEGPTTYDLWSDERQSLKALVQRLEGRD
jgi:hypothetical protein